MGIPLPARRSLVLAVTALALGVPGRVGAAERIAVVDYQLIFDRYEGTQDAQRTLDRELKEWDQQAKEMRKKISELGDEIESQRLMLSEERLREKQDELRRLREEYQSFAESIWGVNGKAAQRNAELTRPIAERILEVIARVAEEQNLDVVLDAGTGGVVWAREELNMTETILDELALSVKEAREKGSEGVEGEAGE